MSVGGSVSNIELLQRMAEAFNRDGWEGVLPFLSRDFEFHEPPEQPAPRVFHGPDEARAGWRGWSEAWAEQRSETREVIELADGRILVLTTQHFRARDGLEITQPNASIFTVSEGKISRWEAFWEEATALEAAGLSE
jgi:ketosteroid isomerase-like protein